MNVSNLSNLFQQNSIFQHGRPLGQKLGQPLVSDTLHWLSQNFLTAQEQGQDLRKRFDTLELSAEAVGSKADSALSEMPKELLEVYLNQYKVAANLSHQNEAALMEYRDQLTAFDQTIQEYQNMLDGKAELPQTMKLEDVSMLLERTRAAREQFLQEGAKELNCRGSEGPDLTDRAHQTVMGDLDDGCDLRWSIDTAAGDIYGEIDRALASVQKVSSMCREGASRIVAELKRRGQADQPYHQLRFDEQDSAVERTSMFQDIYEDIWNTFRQSINEEG
jgi:hypothetical protein